jgi:hypothetical protein
MMLKAFHCFKYMHQTSQLQFKRHVRFHNEAGNDIFSFTFSYCRFLGLFRQMHYLRKTYKKKKRSGHITSRDLGGHNPFNIFTSLQFILLGYGFNVSKCTYNKDGDMYSYFQIIYTVSIPKF